MKTLVTIKAKKIWNVLKPSIQDTAESLLEDDILLRALHKIEIIMTNYLFSRKSLRYWRCYSFLARPRGWLFLFFNHRMHKAAQGVLHSWDEYEHLNKLWPCSSRTSGQALGVSHISLLEGYQRWKLVVGPDLQVPERPVQWLFWAILYAVLSHIHFCYKHPFG